MTWEWVRGFITVILLTGITTGVLLLVRLLLLGRWPR